MSLGVDISIDDLDIYPGDSLPRKIFEELIKDCKNFIVVLSENSISSKWVNEELDAGMIQKIENGARLIPIVLDNIKRDKIPNRLGHVFLHYIKDLNLTDNDAILVSNICFGNHEVTRPKPSPRKIEMPETGIPTLDKTENFIFNKIVETLMERDDDHMAVKELIDLIPGQFTTQEIRESLETIDSRHYINLERDLSNKIENFYIIIEWQSIMTYLRHCYNDPDNNLVRPIAAYISDHKEQYLNSANIADEVSVNRFLTRHLVSYWEALNYVICSKGLGEVGTGFYTTPSGNKYFRKVLI